MSTIESGHSTVFCYDHETEYPMGAGVPLYYLSSSTGKEFAVRRAVDQPSASDNNQYQNYSFKLTEAEQAGRDFVHDVRRHVDPRTTQLQILNEEDRIHAIIKVVQLGKKDVKGWRCHACLSTLKIMIPLYLFHNQDKVFTSELFNQHFTKLINNLEHEASKFNQYYDIDELVCILRGIKEIHDYYGPDLESAQRNQLREASDKFFLMINNAPSFYENNNNNKLELIFHQKEINLNGQMAQRFYQNISYN